MDKEKTQRNAEIMRRLRAGESLAALVREYGISRVRIKQIRAVERAKEEKVIAKKQ